MSNLQVLAAITTLAVVNVAWAQYERKSIDQRLSGFNTDGIPWKNSFISHRATTRSPFSPMYWGNYPQYPIYGTISHPFHILPKQSQRFPVYPKLHRSFSKYSRLQQRSLPLLNGIGLPVYPQVYNQRQAISRRSHNRFPLHTKFHNHRSPIYGGLHRRSFPIYPRLNYQRFAFYGGLYDRLFLMHPQFFYRRFPFYGGLYRRSFPLYSRFHHQRFPHFMPYGGLYRRPFPKYAPMNYRGVSEYGRLPHYSIHQIHPAPYLPWMKPIRRPLMGGIRKPIVGAGLIMPPRETYAAGWGMTA